MTQKQQILSLKNKGLTGAKIARLLSLSKYQVYYITNHQKWRKANMKRYLAYHRPYEKEWRRQNKEPPTHLIPLK